MAGTLPGDTYCGPNITVTHPMRYRPHHTRKYIPYSLQPVCGFFNIPISDCARVVRRGLRFLSQSLTVCRCLYKGSTYSSVIYCAFQKHGTLVQKPPSQSRFSLPSIIILLQSQATNLETQKHAKWIEIHKSQTMAF